MNSVSAIFVYCTLQQGEVRARFWPRPPQAILPARVPGTLYDLGPYPALVPGNDWVRGELWVLAEEDLEETLRVLDRVEGYAQPGERDWYRRDVIECILADGTRRQAFVYYHARPEEIRHHPRVMPDSDGVRHWPTGRCSAGM